MGQSPGAGRAYVDDPQAPRRRFWSSAWISATPTIRLWIDPDLASEPSVGSEDLLLSLAGDVTFDHVMLFAGGVNPGQFKDLTSCR